MNFLYRINPDENLVRITCTGDISIGDLITNVGQVHADPDFKVGMNTIADLTDAGFALDFAQAEKFKNYVKQIELSRDKPCKWALYAPTPAACDPAALFKLIFQSDMIDVRIFDDKKAAMQWVMAGNNPSRD